MVVVVLAELGDVVVVDEAAGPVVVVVEPELELPQPAAKSAAEANKAAPVTTRFNLKPLASFLISDPLTSSGRA